MPFQLESNYKPRGDQAQAIGKLIKAVEAGNRHQTLLGVTGSGKTFTIANVIRELDRPTLVISHNKTLAAQLYSEFKQFFPRNAVEYFVSYFDYYQPEAYIPRSDTYIEKDSSINEEIERLRLAATSALLSRRDTIVVASVSCIYGVSSPEDYLQMLLTVKRGQHISREAVLGRLIDMLYERNDVNFARGRFRVRGDVVEVYPASADEEGIRIEFFGDEIEAITRFDPLTGHAHESLSVITFFPAKQFVTPADKLNRALRTIREELDKNYPNRHLVGRNGMHKYNNQDHAMMTAMLCAKNIVAGEQVFDLWEVNQDAEYHEAGKAGDQQQIASGATGLRAVPTKVKDEQKVTAAS